MTNFESVKAELTLKYRLGLEHALAKANFLNLTNRVLLQAFTVFLILARRHISPRLVWLMTLARYPDDPCPKIAPGRRAF
jgi:hypothetical protein